MTQQFPDISDLLQAKARRRRELAALSWEEKIKIVERMKQFLPKNAWQDQRRLVQSSPRVCNGGLMPTITLLAGAPAVGKSTAARALAARSSKSLHVPVDALREMVVSGMAWPAGEWSPALIEQVALARSSALQMAKAYCDAGFDVVIDDFWDPHSQMEEYARFAGATPIQKILLLPDQTVAETRNRARSGDGGSSDYIAEGIRIVYQDLVRVAPNLPARGWRVIDTTGLSVDETVDAILTPAR